MSARSPFLRRLFRFLRGPCIVAPRWTEHQEMFARARIIVWFFYALTLFKLYPAAREFWPLNADLGSMKLLWPLFWLPAAGTQAGGLILANLFLLAGFAGLMLWRYLPVRILVSVALLLHAAYVNSFGAINHGLHEWFWISVCLWFLPSGGYETLKASRAGRVQFLWVVGACGGLILLFYTLSGIWKCNVALLQMLNGGFGGFSPEAMAYTVAHRAMQTDSNPLWGEVVINWPLLGWPFYIGLYYVELVAIFVCFRPTLLQAWGVILVLFHIGTLTFLDIVFADHVLLNSMFFIMAPSAVARPSLRTMAAGLPVLGIPLRLAFGWSAASRLN